MVAVVCTEQLYFIKPHGDGGVRDQDQSQVDAIKERNHGVCFTDMQQLHAISRQLKADVLALALRLSPIHKRHGIHTSEGST